MSPKNYAEEIGTIIKIQDAVLKTAPLNKGIPLSEKREPKDLYMHHYGLCYDRSRTIEKALNLMGFKTRHISVYTILPNDNIIMALLKRHDPSHAISEVLTSKGWLVVDSNAHGLA